MVNDSGKLRRRRSKGHESPVHDRPRLLHEGHRHHLDAVVVFPASGRHRRDSGLPLWDTEGHLDEYLPGAFQHIRFGIASMHKNVMPVLDADAHTEAYIRAMDHACIDLIGHPGIPSYPIDAERLVRAVAERGRLIEINNNSFVARPGCDVNCRKIARLCMQYDVRVCVDSDAHFCANVGEVPKALEMLDSIGFPPELIVNSTFERFEAYIAEREARMKTASVL